ncbi:hypothetical protein yc1106_06907 [Curvularia clavata]|uniref:Uncharacterized protein n=1 Tax=Curvularia clavata TaxID=95742 RepID=A0A9Q8ZF74_CURCL|nr:hypothetical protein yc1106_06907 [Curvularia clavata]
MSSVSPLKRLLSPSLLSLLPLPIARRVSGTRGVAKEASVTVKTVKPLYERHPRPQLKPSAAVVSRNKLPATKALASATRQSAAAPRKPSPLPLRACARSDYKQTPEFAFDNSRIPRPVRPALKAGPVRTTLGMRVRLADVSRYLKARRMFLSVAQPEEVASCAEKILEKGQDALDVPVPSAKETAVEPQCQASAGTSACKSPKEDIKAASAVLAPTNAKVVKKIGRAPTPKVAKPRPTTVAKVDKKTMVATKPQSLRKVSPLARRQKLVEKSRPGVDRKIKPANRGQPKAVVSQPLAAKPALRTTRAADSAVVKKQVSFVEGLSSDVAVKQPLVPGSAPTVIHSSRSPLANPRAKHVFTAKTAGSVTLKRRFLDRFASVQAYEAQRRKDALAAGEQPGLGQLDYGNSVFRIALQASEVIASDDIGMLMDVSSLGKAAPQTGGRGRKVPVWVFGSFKEPFRPAAIPKERAPVHRKPKA